MLSSFPLTVKNTFKWMTLLVCTITVSHAQSLEDYVQEGLKSNLVLQQKAVTLEQGQQSLKIAKSYFLPSVNMLADYTSGEGGRSIAIPVGDLLNPVYASLNELTQSDGFPQIENVKENFFPKNFYDAKLRTSIPLVNTDLMINRTIQGQRVMVQQFELDAYKRELILDIKTAYYNYLAAEAAVKIYESALTLVEHNVVVNESLLRHGKSLPANVLRSKSEYERIKAESNSARNQQTNAQQYFNFLLNRDLQSAINTSPTLAGIMVGDTLADSNPREEIQMIQTLQEINKSSLQMSRMSRLPKVNAFLDLGTQAFDWKFNDDSRYYLVGVQLSVPIFQGFRNDITIRQNKLEIQKTTQQLLNTRRRLELASARAKNQLQTSFQNYQAAQEQLKAAQSYFKLVEKGHQEGVNSLIEFLDARNQLTSSELQLNLRQLEVLTAQAHVERETASYLLNH